MFSLDSLATSRYLENGVKEYKCHVTSAISYTLYPISPTSKIDQNSKQVTREDRNTTHIRIKNHAINCNTGKINILEILNAFSEQTYLLMNLYQTVDSRIQLGYNHITIPCKMFFGQCVWKIKEPDHCYVLNWNHSLSSIAKCQDLLPQSYN